MGDPFDWKGALVFLGDRLPDVASQGQYSSLLQKESPSIGQIRRLLHGYLLQPVSAITVAIAFRPVLSGLVVECIDDLLEGQLESTALPEQAAVALVNILSFAPHLETKIMEGLNHFVPPVESLIQMGPATLSVPALQLAMASLRLLQLKSHTTRPRMLLGIENLLLNKDVDIRWVAVECIALLYDLSDAAKQSLSSQLVGQEAATKCAFAWREDCSALAVQQAAVWLPSPRHFGAVSAADDGGKVTTTGWRHPGGDVPGFANVCGVLLPSRQEAATATEATGGLVTTPTVVRNMEAAAMALCQKRPLLLEGPPGCGKSALVSELARLTGNSDVVTVHVDDQMDSKTLLGSYIATTTPGEFVWQAGLLTQAVTHGRWVVIEDVNLAPPDVLAALIPLLDSRELHLSQRGQTIRAAPTFQLIATITCSPGGGAMGAYGDSQGVVNMLGGLFSSVMLDPPPLGEQASILAAAFPGLPLEVVGGSMAALHVCQRAGGHEGPLGDAGSLLPGWELAVEGAMAAAGLRAGDLAASFGHHFSLRDLFKLCARLQACPGATPPRGSADASAGMAGLLKLHPAFREAAFMECMDCFAAMIADPEMQKRLLLAFASIWGLESEMVERTLTLSKPTIQVSAAEVRVGRARLARLATPTPAAVFQAQAQSFAHTAQVLRTMEAVAVAICQREAALLVGETGTGKSTLVQHIADQVGARLVVLNLSQQTDSADLLGGFRPVQPAEAFRPLLERFSRLFTATFTRGDNGVFLSRISKFAQRGKWQSLLQAFKSALTKVEDLRRHQQEADDKGSASKKRKNALTQTIRQEWQSFAEEVATAEKVAAAADGGVAFAFIEGSLIKAVREGSWLLLDEINLAPPEALERIAGLLEGGGSIVLSERGDMVPITRHPNFRLLAAMNPATDSGKRDLPAQLRQRFTELYVPEMTGRGDLQQVVLSYLRNSAQDPPVDAIIDFYLASRREAVSNLQDSAGGRPSYNLRTLTRALQYASRAWPVYGLKRALFDGLAMAFLTQLHPGSTPLLEGILQRLLLGSSKPKDLKALMQRIPSQPPGGQHVLFEHFWVEAGPLPLLGPEASLAGGRFVMTPSVSMHLRNLARAVLCRYPILLQGPTSSGKTTLVSYLAARTGHRCIRINNHEGTDLQEYLGSYISDEQGRLVFREGALVTALRQGHWVVLDELNLAPSEVLEALNRLLDDNRELYVPELHEVVKPHPHFMLFATQNPAGTYAGRKFMSRAFRSRFLELHVGDIPDTELATILHQRCSIAPSHADKLVSVMKELQRWRQGSNVFAGKHGLITPRDLFKWANRGAVTYQQLAENGYMLLAERLRSQAERDVVQKALESVMGVQLDMAALYEQGSREASQLADAPQQEVEAQHGGVQGIVWTPSMGRMYTLVDRCLEFAEPVLLVGETGTGKTTVCQMAARNRGQRLHILNCNQHTEASDFLGGFRPSRHRQKAIVAFQSSLQEVRAAAEHLRLDPAGLDDPPSFTTVDLKTTCSAAVAALSAVQTALAEPNRPNVDRGAVEGMRLAVEQLCSSAGEASAPFEWVDGPLVLAMRRGDILLIDELNLAEDAVLERLNSVLEAGRSLTLAEKGGAGAEEIVAAPGFRLVATMNPGGDYGKRELSPALANRFTSIWVAATSSLAELEAILRSHLQDAAVANEVVALLLDFWQFFHATAGAAKSVLSLRDLLAWAGFINAASPHMGALAAYAHGAHLVLLDGIGLGIGMPSEVGPL